MKLYRIIKKNLQLKTITESRVCLPFNYVNTKYI